MENFDLFGQNVVLSFNQENKFTTKFGALTTITILVVICFLLVGKFSILKNRENQNVTTQQLLEINISAFNLTENNFMIAVQARTFYKNKTRRNPDNVYKISAYQISNQEYLQNPTVYSLTTCDESHFNQISSELQQYIKKYQIMEPNNNFYCLDYKNIPFFQLEGLEPLNSYLQIQIAINKCNISNNKNCMTDQELSQQDFVTQIDAYFTNSVVNPYVNYGDSEIQNYLSNVYIEGNSDNIPNRVIYLQKNQLFIDNSIMPYIVDENQLLVYNSPQYNQIQTFREPIDFSEQVVGIIEFQLSQTTNKIKKNYQKFDQFLSYMGGLVQIMLGTLGMIAVFYNKFYLNMTLAHQLYDIPSANHPIQCIKAEVQIVKQKVLINQTAILKFKKITHIILKQLKIIKQNPSFNRLRTNSSVVLEQIKINLQQQPQENSLLDISNQSANLFIQSIRSKRKFLSSIFDKMISQQVKLKFYYKYMISSLFFHKYFFSEDKEVKILRKVSEQIEQDLDIYQILRNFQELRKLKEVILNKDQLKVFNFIPRLKIQLEDDQLTLEEKKSIQRLMTSKPNIENLKKSQLKLIKKKSKNLPKLNDSEKKIKTQYFHLNHSYSKLINIKKINQDLFSKRVNRKLKKLLGNDLAAVFQVAQQFSDSGKEFLNDFNKIAENEIIDQMKQNEIMQQQLYDQTNDKPQILINCMRESQLLQEDIGLNDDILSFDQKIQFNSQKQGLETQQIIPEEQDIALTKQQRKKSKKKYSYKFYRPSNQGDDNQPQIIECLFSPNQIDQKNPKGFYQDDYQSNFIN